MKILVVEDEPDIALILEYALKDAGHQVLGPAQSADAAYQLADEHRPELALIDINLKDGHTGAALALRLANLGIPSVYVSGNPEEALQARDPSLGFIAKPYRVNAVVQAVDVIEVILSGEIPVWVPEELNLFKDVRAKIRRKTDR